ncbi:hypothetical protein SORBI_3001G075201 [Sorghum bicolor]|uniref:Uncharacterized protein n=1 Tax=Sorghum bicolor TaxID=4558 RepID=A0A1Z5S4Q0_SORBI|nr:hypothetical protein SORBI_3001G075201 [Sorghum bicolor]
MTLDQKRTKARSNDQKKGNGHGDILPSRHRCFSQSAFTKDDFWSTFGGREATSSTLPTALLGLSRQSLGMHTQIGAASTTGPWSKWGRSRLLAHCFGTAIARQARGIDSVRRARIGVGATKTQASEMMERHQRFDETSSSLVAGVGLGTRRAGPASICGRR